MEIKPNRNLNNVNSVNGDGNGNGNGDSVQSWSFDTNWTVARGSLDTSVTVESSDSVIDDDDDDTKAVDTKSGSHPLILKPPSPDSGPCEIKICFTQKYEIRQVYLRSTARVYEIYYAPSAQASNEYLCTIRCSSADRDGETLQVSNFENVTQQSAKVSTGELAQAKYTGETNSSASEDDWVEVRVPETPLFENRISYLPNKTNINGVSNIQDLYEATAEISDADPCTTITIRLLSLQNKGCLYVDEVYVFADPVDSSELENQPAQLGSSAGSTLMTMFLPTLLQLSKSSASQMHEKNASNKLKMDAGTESISVDPANVVDGTHLDEKLSVEQQNAKFHDNRVEPARFLPTIMQLSKPGAGQVHENNVYNKLKRDAEMASKSVYPTNVADGTHQDEKFSVDEQNEKLYDHRAPRSHDPGMDGQDVPSSKNDLPNARIERLLEQLVSRVSRVEDFCSRFEENLLKPINSMEARLQQVEQKLEVLSKNSQYSGQPNCTRICAPSFTCESNSSSIYDDSSRHTAPSGIPELEKRDTPDMSNLSNEPPSESSLQFLPGLMITAPEFSCGEDDEEDADVMKSSEVASLEKTKTLSIDDALAAALSGFLCSSNSSPEDTEAPQISASGCTSTATDNDEPGAQTLAHTSHKEPSEFALVLSVTAPEFIVEGGDEEHLDYTQSLSFSASQSMSKEDGNANRTSTEDSEVGNSEVSPGSWVLSGRDTLPDDVSSAGCEKQHLTGSYVDSDEQFQSCEEENIDKFEGGGDVCSAGLAVGFGETNNCQINEESSPREPCNDMPSVQNNNGCSFAQNQVNDKRDSPEQAAESTKRVARDVFDKFTLLNLEGSSYTSMVDLEFPILDVKFTRNESSNLEFSLEGLIHDVADTNSQTTSVQGIDETSTGEQADMLFRDSNAVDTPIDNFTSTDNILLLDFTIDREDTSLNSSGGLDDLSTSNNHFMLASLI